MKLITPGILIALLAAWLPSGALAEIRFAPIFNDGAVLQCEMETKLWGEADPGAEVAVGIDGKEIAKASADGGGKWMVALPAQAPGGPHRIEASAGADRAGIADVWFGEVWLASGQSNMAMNLSFSHGGEERMKMALPEIRFVKVPPRLGLPPEREFTPADLAWKTFGPGPSGEIAAVAFYFAEKLQPAVGRKVGIIQSSWGGTPCEAWTPLDALDAKPELKHYADEIRAGLASGKSAADWKAEAGDFWKKQNAFREWAKKKEGPAPENPKPIGKQNPFWQQSPTVLFENLIVPLIPYTARGAIWYQGEGNAGNPQEYRVLFPAMIASWRERWGRPDWPFFFVQLAAFGTQNGDWAGLRDAQRYTRDTLPHTGMAVAIDCGDKTDIHPWAKQPVGERLALLALDQVYGQKIASRGPSFAGAKREGARLLISFDHVGEGLETADGKPEVPGFEIAAASGEFHPAKAKIASGGTVELSCDAVVEPARARYAWAAWVEPPVTLRNSAGLAAEPFEAAAGEKRP
jgi:sialate O-acetylesterase